MKKPQYSLTNLLLLLAFAASLFAWWADHRMLTKTLDDIQVLSRGREMELSVLRRMTQKLQARLAEQSE